MHINRLHNYVKETREYIYPLASYVKNEYPELSTCITILKSKIVSLTELTETLTVMYDEKIAFINAEKNAKIEQLKTIIDDQQQKLSKIQNSKSEDQKETI